MTSYLKALDDVQNYDDVEDERVLSSIGVSFGFEGKGKELFIGHYPKQVHGTAVVEASDSTHHDEHRVQADGIYTQNPSVKIGVQTADCVPILLASEDKKVVMALHAGWRGLTAGIVGLGVKQLKKLHPNAMIYAAIGPSIAHCHYEVGLDVVEALDSESLGLNVRQLAYALTKGVGDRWFLDLPTVGIFALLQAGLQSKHISVFHSCTYCKSEKWHSFRRDKEKSVRNWSWIQSDSV